MENKTIPGVGKNIIFIFSENEKRYLPKIKNIQKNRIVI